jgi:hypothetical protein
MLIPTDPTNTFFIIIRIIQCLLNRKHYKKLGVGVERGVLTKLFTIF